MDQPALWLVAVNAFAAVVLLLGALAGAIRLLSIVFPERAAPVTATAEAAPTTAAALDAPTLAAIQVSVQRLLPGGRIVHVEDATGGPR